MHSSPKLLFFREQFQMVDESFRIAGGYRKTDSDRKNSLTIHRLMCINIPASSGNSSFTGSLWLGRLIPFVALTLRQSRVYLQNQEGGGSAV